MILQDAINLIKHDAVTEQPAARWADLGCGNGFFTYALANLLQKESEIYAFDKSLVTLQQLSNPNNIIIQSKQLNFIKEQLPVNNLDGILMANSFHYVADKISFIKVAGKHLSADGIFLIVEYDTDKPNQWVPYPASVNTLQKVFANAGYTSFTKIAEMPSAYRSGKIYSAAIKK